MPEQPTEASRQAGAVEKTKVLVVDDSVLIRNLLSRLINAQSDMVAVGSAPDPLIAQELIRNLQPDVLTLDIEMPRMDGLAFLEQLMRTRPLPVVMVSALTAAGAEATLRALELGAVDFVTKPRPQSRQGAAEYAAEITDKIRAAARARPKRPALPTGAGARLLGSRVASREKLIMIGASTGGTEAIREVLGGLPADCPGILITQHMPAGFTRSFADRLNKYCRLAVKEAEDGEPVLPGHAYIAPGSHHLLLKRSGANYVTALSDGPPVNRHRPSVEALFRSGAGLAGPHITGIMLTGMGRDGAAAMRELRDAGAYNIVQDEATSVVFGMPREAIAAGAAHEVTGLHEIAGRVVGHLLKCAGPALRA
jgi:two-component system chemotaxis response regulator CheB